jgi:uncharacterized protein (DUF2062 family)
MSAPVRPSLVERLRGAWRRLLTLDDSPHNIAMGVFIGTFVAYQPIVGAQMIVGAIVCRMIGANVVASLPLAWITNPVTIVPIYFATYKLGVVFTGGEMTYEDIEGIFDQIAALGFWNGLVEGYRFLAGIFWPMVVGGAIVGVVNGVAFYVVVRRVVARFQAARPRRAGATGA